MDAAVPHLSSRARPTLTAALFVLLKSWSGPLCWILAISWVLLALPLTLRALGGVPHQALSFTGWLLFVTGTLVWWSAVRSLAQYSGCDQTADRWARKYVLHPRWPGVIAAATSLCWLLSHLTVGGPGGGFLGAFIALGVCSLELVWTWHPPIRKVVQAVVERVLPFLPAISLPTHVMEPVAEPDDWCCQLVHRVSDEGQEEWSGSLRIRLVAGQRNAVEHLSFCPAFAVRPHLELEQQAGPAARLKVAQLLPHGARIEVKLLTPAEEATHVVVDFVATAEVAAARQNGDQAANAA